MEEKRVKNKFWVCRRKLLKHSSINQTNRINGITLIALVVTIVVLLILAGISINLLWGEHGILNSAKNSGVQAKIAEIEDQANVIYKGLETEKLIGTKENITMGEIIAKLQANGYTIEQETGEGNVVTGITLDNTKLSLLPNKSATITVTPKQSTDGNVYYAVIEGKAYKMDFTEGGVVIQKTPTDKEITPSEINVDAKSSDEEITGKPEINGMVVNITAKQEGTATITINYGGQTAICEVTVKIKPEEGAIADVENVTFSTAYGKIDVIWLKGTGSSTEDVVGTPNAPELYSGENALKPVTWTYNETAKTWSEDSNSQSTWYNYTVGTGTQDNNSSMWANAKNADGSYFVWIPRYAYRITYYENDPNTNTTQKPTGYYDGYGMWKANDGSLKCALESGIETVDYNGESYIVHPAFMKDNGKTDKNGNAIADFDRGGWDKNLTGFWIAKYEMSMETNGSHTETKSVNDGNVATSSTTKAVSKPGVSSWRAINVANCYANSLNYDTSKKSHLIKNSEWGAVAYLTQSSYGRNGHEIDINNSSTYITGNGGGAVGGTASTASGVTNAYNTQLGAKASTTGNIYGVYDMSGGSSEYTAIFNKSHSGGCFSNTDYKPATGNHFATTDGNSTQYATAYSNSTGKNYGAPLVYSVSKTGDGIKEVYTGNNDLSWYYDSARYVNQNSHPFAYRGGHYNDGVNAGVFSSYVANGGGSFHSFRVCLAL